jgi:transcriptional regulator with PAS, ATPase and Fis domain
MKDVDLLAKSLSEIIEPYSFNEVMACALKFFFRNPFESAIVIDRNMRIQFMDKVSEEFFGFKRGEAKGMDIRELVPGSGLPPTVETGIPMIGRILEVKGKKRIGAAYPLKQNGKIIGGIGKIILQSLEEVERINNEIQQLKQEIHYLKQKTRNGQGSLYTFDDIIGGSSMMRETIDIAKKVSLLGVDVLITGESGTGKELFAHSIHGYAHSNKPFVKVNCPAIPFELAESELFGYEKGAFTGASTSGKAGSFEMANNGTIFLDEISSLPLSIQAKLLRVLQEKEVTRLGSTKTKKIEFRLITATNVDLKKLVKEGKFRDDLYYRVAKAIINIAPLRERREDVPLYVNHFLEKINRSFKTKIKRVSDRAMDGFFRYNWSGNVRELINLLEQIVIRCWNEEQIGEDCLPDEMLLSENRAQTRYSSRSAVGAMGIRQEIANMEKEFIVSVLKEVDGNKRRAAMLLAMPRSTLYEKLKRYDIRIDESA